MAQIIPDRKHTVVVVSPTIALLSQQSEILENAGVKTVGIYGEAVAKAAAQSKEHTLISCTYNM